MESCRVKYQAEDGTLFDKCEECERYDKLPHMYRVRCTFSTLGAGGLRTETDSFFLEKTHADNYYNFKEKSFSKQLGCSVSKPERIPLESFIEKEKPCIPNRQEYLEKVEEEKIKTKWQRFKEFFQVD